MLLQQGEVGTATADCFEKIKAALPGRVRCRCRCCRIDQARAKRVKPFAIGCRELQVTTALTKSLKPLQHHLRLTETQYREDFQCVVAFGLAAPQASQPVNAFLRLREYLFEMPGDFCAMRIENGEQRRPVGKIHRNGDLPAFCLAGWQHVRLRIIDVLQTVFESSQKFVGIAKFLHAFVRQQAACAKQGKYFERRPDLQGRITTATNELENLRHELDFANAAGAELDVVDHILARHLATDLGMQVAHCIDCAEVEIFPEDERARDFFERGHPFRLQVVAFVHYPCLDPGVALPLPPLRNEIVFQRIK